MEDNRKFATFFADAPKGKKIGAVLSWIATVILLVALFVPGYQLRYQMKTEKGTFKDKANFLVFIETPPVNSVLSSHIT